MNARALVDGEAEGAILASDTPLSLWGGLDVQTGEVIDRHHPLSGERVSGRILVLPAGRGSSAASAMLLEALVNGCGPAALVLGGVDEVLVVGAIVADELFGHPIPVLELDGAGFERALGASQARIGAGGSITFDDDHTTEGMT